MGLDKWLNTMGSQPFDKFAGNTLTARVMNLCDNGNLFHSYTPVLVTLSKGNIRVHFCCPMEIPAASAILSI
jgi:hypothetical protein